MSLLLLATILSLPQFHAGARPLVLPLRSKPAANTHPRLLLDGAYQLHGTVKDLEYFYVSVELGTPPREYDLIVDTGSTMTYVPCETCTACGTHKHAPYGPTVSSTYREVPCNSTKCACGVPNCGCRRQRCVFERNYAEASTSKGYLVEDMLLLHGSQAGQAGLHSVPLVFGCAMTETGAIHRQAADGLMGLGNSNASVINQLVKQGAMRDRFSLCFGSVEGDGALLLGDLDLPGNTILFDYVPMLRTASHYYLVKVDALGLGGTPLSVRQGVFDIGYGVVLDSGTTYTHLPREAYQAFVEALLQHTSAAGLSRVDGPDPTFGATDVCWQGAPTEQELDRLPGVFPTMQIHMPGVTLQLGPWSYLFRHGKVQGAWCLGVFDNGNQGTLLGGITFRNVLVTDAAECAPSVRPAHEDPRSSYDHLNEHVLVRLWDRVTTLRGQQGANHKHHRRRPHGG